MRDQFVVRQRDVSPMVSKHPVDYPKSISCIIGNLDIAIFDLILFAVL